MAMNLTKNDPLVATNFFLEITQEVVSNITSVDGLRMEVDATEFAQRGTKGVLIQHKMMSKQKLAGELTFKRIQPNTIGADPIWKWFLLVRNTGMKATGRTTPRRTGSIVGYDSALVEVSRWNFTEAWPSKIEADGYDVTKNDPIHESVTLQYESLVRTK
ncbi:MAG: phage tail protein [Acidimicrobiales bacterium]